MKDIETEQQEVWDAIPHRPPFLFVDKILNLREDAIEVEKVLQKDEYFFQGHYPNMPIMPGVLMCEAIFQAAGVLLSKTLLKDRETAQGKVPVLTRIQEAKFKKMAFPGDKLVLEARFLQALKNFYFFKGSAKKDGNALVFVAFTLGLVEEMDV
ncbi:MAG: 3-hydroxyacyl-ACP dehydratase FabZ [Puniceicoccales bacterium]|jgi:3-hydroxyacyl-[acyl-carrier-protein] dehydratase|nr:3-hydroxyacyl-ACP dehydratase FabZ [Puniceicoccales bacterium]